ncbi:MAG: GIY-YIG nuclease family protein [Chloroflexi bacterium]|nr:GIY-YIG nuclease family protein [Chloroflexota bacterium]
MIANRTYYVYIMASRSKTLYIGVTNDLERRVREHQTGALGGFTQKYNVHRLIYYEESNDVQAAIAREKQLKGWRRSKKLALIESANPEWDDLSENWFTGQRDPSMLSG